MTCRASVLLVGHTCCMGYLLSCNPSSVVVIHPQSGIRCCPITVSYFLAPFSSSNLHFVSRSYHSIYIYLQTPYGFHEVGFPRRDARKMHIHPIYWLGTSPLLCSNFTCHCNARPIFTMLHMPTLCDL
ncbi:hypothetical protein BDN67DRAFT_815821 [Paxillus ammoniavirescens]|nr:hypothetical protein BDN67DRAFT_815821 [Paxillus ammoniavirescens]